MTDKLIHGYVGLALQAAVIGVWLYLLVIYNGPDAEHILRHVAISILAGLVGARTGLLANGKAKPGDSEVEDQNPER